MSHFRSLLLVTVFFLATQFSLPVMASPEKHSNPPEQPGQPQPAPYPGQPQLPPPTDDWNQRGISLQYLGFWYTGPNCFIVGQPDLIPGHVVPVLQKGAVMVQTTAGFRLMTPYDPIVLTRFAYRNRIDDMVTSTPQGVGLYPRNSYLPLGYVEIFQRPLEAGPCNYGQ